MKTKSIYQGIALLAMALTTAACQNEINEDTNEPKPGEKVNMTIRATQGTTPKTRTSYEDKLEVTDINEIVVTWESTEKIKVFGYTVNELDYSADFNSIDKSLSGDGKSISFEGSIDTKDHYLAMYPAKDYTCVDNGTTILTSFLNQTQNCVTPMAHLKDFDFMVGELETAGESDKFIFTHQATMIRFILDLPSSEEKITKVSLSSTKQLYSGLYTTADVTGGTTGVDDLSPVSSLDLIVTDHTPSEKPLKAYMMMPPFDASGDVLKVTVNTKNGSIYEGSINAAVSQELVAGSCYTLSPTLTVTSKINIPVEEDKLGEALKDFTPASTQTELALTGKVSNTDLTALATFLKEDKSKSITTLDLSDLTIASTSNDSDGAPIITVTGFADCKTLTDVKLPVEATTIGDGAFKGCTALKNVSQDEPTTDTRASISSRLKTVGAKAFKGTAIDVMFLHANISKVGDNAFDGCTALTALVFEGTKSVGSEAANLKLGTNIVAGTNADLKIFLPNIDNETTATTYTIFEKPIYYNFAGYGSANAEDKENTAKYTFLPHGNGIGGLTGGGEWGSSTKSL